MASTSRSRQRWLEAGLDILAGSGIAAVTIEALATRLGLSKGSFYHHFDGMPGYRRALLLHFEERESKAFIAQATTAEVPPGEPRLRKMVADVLAADGGRPQLEDAVRHWATSDPVAREHLDRIDRSRIEFVREQFAAMDLEPQTAADYALIAHLVSVGVAHTTPPLPPEQIGRLWDQLLAAAHGASAGDPSRLPTRR